MKTIIVGNHGLLGNALQRVGNRLGLDVIPLDLPDFDISSRMFVLDAICPLRPDVIINAAGLGQIDWLETHPNTARSIHVQGTAHLREAAKRTDAILLQFSTAEVFGTASPENNEKTFSETDVPEPVSVYSKTKLDSERAASEWEKHLIVRTSLLFGNPTPRSAGNLVETLLNAVRRTRQFQVLSDMSISPGWTDQIAEAAFSLVQHSQKHGTTGLFHVSNQGTASFFDLAAELARCIGIPLELKPITREEYGFKVHHTPFCALNCSKYQELSGVFPLPRWETALADYIQSRSPAGFD